MLSNQAQQKEVPLIYIIGVLLAVILIGTSFHITGKAATTIEEQPTTETNQQKETLFTILDQAQATGEKTIISIYPGTYNEERTTITFTEPISYNSEQGTQWPGIKQAINSFLSTTTDQPFSIELKTQENYLITDPDSMIPLLNHEISEGTIINVNTLETEESTGEKKVCTIDCTCTTCTSVEYSCKKSSKGVSGYTGECGSCVSNDKSYEVDCEKVNTLGSDEMCYRSCQNDGSISAPAAPSDSACKADSSVCKDYGGPDQRDPKNKGSSTTTYGKGKDKKS